MLELNSFQALSHLARRDGHIGKREVVSSTEAEKSDFNKITIDYTLCPYSMLFHAQQMCGSALTCSEGKFSGRTLLFGKKKKEERKEKK